jgi:hypothetical protein
VTTAVNSDYSERYRELHVAHMALMQDRDRDQRVDATRQALASDQAARIQRARELDRDLGQHIDQLA